MIAQRKKKTNKTELQVTLKLLSKIQPMIQFSLVQNQLNMAIW